MLAIWNYLQLFLAFLSIKIKYNSAKISEETCTLHSRDVYVILKMSDKKLSNLNFNYFERLDK